MTRPLTFTPLDPPPSDTATQAARRFGGVTGGAAFGIGAGPEGVRILAFAAIADENASSGSGGNSKSSAAQTAAIITPVTRVSSPDCRAIPSLPYRNALIIAECADMYARPVSDGERRMLLRVRTLSLVLISLVTWLPALSPAQTRVEEPGQKPLTVRVPFVGCMSDGQQGPIPAPKGAEIVVQIDAEKARRLAYYKDEDSRGVLAPRGWHCFGTYGSNANTLYVTPRPIKKNGLFSAAWGGFTGPVIAVSEIYGDTSGRFEVARIIARVFPGQMAFVQKIINEGIEPASDFPSGPYPNDLLNYRTDRIVEFQTPPHSEGLGTVERVQKNNDPIDGAVILAGQPSDGLSLVTVRLPSGTRSLKPNIIRQFEQDNRAGLPKN